MSSTAANLPIAIVGVSALFPGSSDATGFWRDILAGRDLIADVPATHWRIDDYYDADPSAPDKTYAKRGGFLSPVDFDALGWGVPPSTLPATDTSQLLALIVAQAVLQDAAREQFESMDRSRISVILGVTSAQELLFSMVSRLQKPVWVKALRESGIPEDEVQAACARIAAHYRAVAGGEFSRLARQCGRRAHRQSLEPRWHQLRHRCGVRVLVERAGDGGQRVAARSQRPGDRRRRRHAQRHLHVHVFLEDPRAVAERRLPAVQRPGRRHHARRGPGHGRAQAAC